MQSGGHEHVDGTRVLKLRAQIRRQHSALTPHRSGENRAVRLSEQRVNACGTPCPGSRQPKGRIPHIGRGSLDDADMFEREDDTAFGFDVALRRLAGIARFIE